MRVVVSPDKFKGCLTAAQVTDAVANGLLEERPDLRITRLPVADGGDGTVAAALSRGFDKVTMSAAGPTGVTGQVSYARQGQRAVIELAAICGLDRLPNGRPDAVGASTYGLGEVIGHAIEHGAREVVLGIGGSASTDGGAGMTQALGARLLDPSGAELAHGGAALSSLASLDVAGLRKRMAGVRVLVASDVDHPLLGPRGAAAVFGPQKGASPDDVSLLEDGLTRWAGVVKAAVDHDYADHPGAGAAGGTGFAALALLDAELRSGIELILELLRFDEAVAGADLVVTGEGSLDAQSLAGKAPIGVAQAAARVGVGVVAVAGRTQLSPDRLRAAGIKAAYPLSDLEPDPARSIANAAPLLRQVGRIIAVQQLAR
jgi:glycerate 2-kinase